MSQVLESASLESVLKYFRASFSYYLKIYVLRVTISLFYNVLDTIIMYYNLDDYENFFPGYLESMLYTAIR